MTTFQEDWDSAYKEVFKPLKMPDLPKRKPSRSKTPAKPRLTNMGKPGHMNKLKKRGPSKKVLSENAKMQPRQDGKFASKSGSSFWTRLGDVLSGKAQRQVRASKRRVRQMDALPIRASIPIEKRKRTRRRRSRPVVEQPQYRKSVFRQILGF